MNPSSQGAIAVAYFYFDFKDSTKQKSIDFFKSILRQIISKLSEIPESALELYQKCSSTGRQATLAELKDVFILLSRSFVKS